MKKEEPINNSDSGLSYFILILLGLSIVALPSGIIALIMYLAISTIYQIIYKDKNIEKDIIQERKEHMAYMSICFGLGGCIALYNNYSLKEYGLGILFISYILGIISYYSLYRIVNWSTYDLEKKIKLKNKYYKYLLIIIGLYAIYIFGQSK